MFTQSLTARARPCPNFFTSYRPRLRRRLLTAALPGTPPTPHRGVGQGVRVAAKVLLDLNITGVENIPTTGPVILVGNHISFLDPVIVVGLLPRPVIAMAKSEAFEDKFLGPLVRAFDAFPVRRGEIDRQALRIALRVLEAGLLLWISPEGTRSPTGQLQPAAAGRRQRGQNGAAFIAARSGAPVAPVTFVGTDQFKRNIRPPLRGKRTSVTVTIGPPFYLGRGQPLAHGKALDEMTEKVMRRIAALLPPEMRGVYGEG